jgi:beta-fructofuranosidase
MPSLLYTATVVLNLLYLTRAQSSSSISSSLSTAIAASTTASGVPTGTALPGYYGGAYRPQVHFSPPQGFMNDPNGMFVDEKGTYHLYYQCECPAAMVD